MKSEVVTKIQDSGAQYHQKLCQWGCCLTLGSSQLAIFSLSNYIQIIISNTQASTIVNRPSGGSEFGNLNSRTIPQQRKKSNINLNDVNNLNINRAWVKRVGTSKFKNMVQ